MHPLIKFAFGNIRKSKARSGLAIAAVLLGVLLITALLVLTDSLVASINESLSLVSDVVVIREANTIDPTFSTINQTAIQAVINENNTNKALDGLISSYSKEIWYVEKNSQGLFGFAQVFGIQPSMEKKAVGILDSKNIYQGRTLNDADYNASVVGATFALSKGIKVGDYIQVAGVKIKVVGLFTTGTFVDGAIFANLDLVRTFRSTYTNETYSTVLIKPKDLLSGKKIINYVNDHFKKNYQIEASDFQDLASQGRKLLQITLDFAFYIGLISIIIGSLSVFNAILMGVMERKKEIAVLKAIGWTDTEVGIEVFSESMIISTIGGLFGLVGGLLVSIYFTSISDFINLKVYPLTLLKSYGFAVLLGIFAGLYPAFRAIRIDPIIDIND